MEAPPRGKHDLHLHLYFTFMHLADAFIQSDLQCIQAIHIFLFYQYVCSLGIEPMTFCAANAMLYHWATGTSVEQDIYRGERNRDFYRGEHLPERDLLRGTRNAICTKGKHPQTHWDPPDHDCYFYQGGPHPPERDLYI